MKRPQANFSYLLASLVLMLIATPLIEDFSGLLGPVQHVAIELVYFSTLLIGMWSLVREPGHFRIGIVLTLTTLVAVMAVMLGYGNAFRALALGAMLLFFLLTTQLATRQVLHARQVTRNTLMGAICIYLMLGVIFAVLYTFIVMLVPEAFRGLQGSGIDQHYSSLLYFSFATLTTLGYGDLVPLNHIPRNVAILEAIIGQFYLAILVSGLVGLRIANYHMGRDAEQQDRDG